jgi:hypothetical protein
MEQKPKYTTSNLDNEKYKNYSVLKQETLEEAAEFNFGKQVSNPYSTGTAAYTAYEKGFELGAKWQAERMYSESIDFAEWIRVKDFQTTSKDNWIGLDMKYYTTEELFEQFKKK